MPTAFRNFFGIAVLALLVVISAAFEANAQGRGRGFGLGNKCDKFVNCHDARDGRVDGRGPRRGNDFDNWNQRRWSRNRNFDDFDNHHRRHNRFRDFNRDGSWRNNRDGSWRNNRHDFHRDTTWRHRGR